MTDIYERLADENEPAPHHGFEEPWAPVRDRFRRVGLPSFVEVESACIVDGLFHSLALLY